MPNYIDFFQPVQTEASLPCGRASVFLQGRLCPWLKPLELVRKGWPEFSWIRLNYDASTYLGDELVSGQDVEKVVGMGKAVELRRFYNRGEPGVSVDSYPLFAGHIEKIETKLDGNGENIEVIARDLSARLERASVYGQWILGRDGSVDFLAGLDTVFNEAGSPNATPVPVQYDGEKLTLFAVESTQRKMWSCADVIHYLLCRILPKGMLALPAIERLEALTQGQVIRDLDVTGLSITEALRRCCLRADIRFKFVPRQATGGPRQAIVFYRHHTRTTVELQCQQAGRQINASKTNIWKFQSEKSFWPLTHKYVGQGDFKVYEGTFDLLRAWDSSLEDADYDKFSPSTNADFYQVKDVYRKWCLNEAGDYTGSPCNLGEPYDFSKVFGKSKFICRRRRFRPALTTDGKGKSLGYFVEVSFDDGVHWWQYMDAFNMLLDECGIWLSSDRLDVDTWIAALKGVLKFRITASVVSDERLGFAVADGPVGSVIPVVESLITLPRQFQYRKVSPKSIFYNSGNEKLGNPDEVNDGPALREFVRKHAEDNCEAIETIDVQTPYLVFDFEVGDKVVSSPQGRDLLGFRKDNRSTQWIEHVKMDFRKQSSNIHIIRSRGG